MTKHWKDRIDFEVLRSDADLQQLLGYFLRHAAQWDSFLLGEKRFHFRRGG